MLAPCLTPCRVLVLLRGTTGYPTPRPELENGTGSSASSTQEQLAAIARQKAFARDAWHRIMAIARWHTIHAFAVNGLRREAGCIYIRCKP